MKRIFVFIILIFLIVLPSVNAQDEPVWHEIDETLQPQANAMVEVPTSVKGDWLYINLTIQNNMLLNVQIYRGYTMLPSGEVYNGGGRGFLEINVTLEGGLHSIYLYNPDLDDSIRVRGGWALNPILNITNTTTTTTSGTWTDTKTTTRTTTSTIPSNDYIGIFLGVMIAWVLPALLAMFGIFCMWNYFREEGYDYLTIFKEDEIYIRDDNE